MHMLFKNWNFSYFFFLRNKELIDFNTDIIDFSMVAPLLPPDQIINTKRKRSEGRHEGKEQEKQKDTLWWRRMPCRWSSPADSDPRRERLVCSGNHAAPSATNKSMPVMVDFDQFPNIVNFSFVLICLRWWFLTPIEIRIISSFDSFWRDTFIFRLK